MSIGTRAGGAQAVGIEADVANLPHVADTR